MTKKKSYRKPEIKKVNLVAEEAVLSSCKTGSGATGSGNRDCDHGACKKSVYGS